jgi:hypothetical protein
MRNTPGSTLLPPWTKQNGRRIGTVRMVPGVAWLKVPTRAKALKFTLAYREFLDAASFINITSAHNPSRIGLSKRALDFVPVGMPPPMRS